jgi:hypothetical protein
MYPLRHPGAVLLLLAGLSVVPFPAGAAASYDNCVGFIDALPATLATQGVWCLRHDLATAITSGNAITINTNNVTIDCNDFKVSGLAAGLGTNTNGIFADNRLNARVRHCRIRGFLHGVHLAGANGGGHVVEDNRFDGNTHAGAYVEGDGSVLRHNQINDTGGPTVPAGDSAGIWTVFAVDILDNTIVGVKTSSGSVYGIRTDGNPNGSISDNRVRGVDGHGIDYGIYNVNSGSISLDHNQVIGPSAGNGLTCTDAKGQARDNIVNAYGTALSGCSDAGNVVVTF